MTNLSEGLIKGLMSMGLDKLIAGQLKKFQQEENCPQALRKIDARELVGDAMHFMKFRKEEQEERKAYGSAFFQKYFVIFEPLIMLNLLMYEQKAGAKYEVLISIDKDDIFFEKMEALKNNPEYGSKIYPQLEEMVREEDSDLETAIFNMIRSMMDAQGQPLSMKCTMIKKNMESGEVISREDRLLSEVRGYFKTQ